MRGYLGGVLARAKYSIVRTSKMIRFAGENAMRKMDMAGVAAKGTKAAPKRKASKAATKTKARKTKVTKTKAKARTGPWFPYRAQNT